MAEDYALRVAVVDKQNNLLSSVWRIWVKGNDIYVAIRTLAPIFKTSLHASGNFRNAFVNDKDSIKHQGAGKDRAVQKWFRPASGNHGGTWLFQVLIPAAGLQSIGLPAPGKLVSLQAFHTDDVGYISLLEFPEELGTRPIQFGNVVGTVIGSHALPRGTFLYVIWHVQPVSHEQMPTFLEVSRLAKVIWAAAKRRFDSADTYRSFVTFDNQDGIGRILDFGVEAMANYGSQLA